MPEKTPIRGLDTGVVWSPCMSRQWGAVFSSIAQAHCICIAEDAPWSHTRRHGPVQDSYGAQCQAISRRTSNIGALTTSITSGNVNPCQPMSTHVNSWLLKTFCFSIVSTPKPVIILPYFSGVSLGVSLVHSIQTFPHRPLNTARFSGAPCRPPNWRRPWWIWNGASERCRWGSYGGLEIARIIQCEAPKIAKLFYNSNNYGLWYL